LEENNNVFIRTTQLLPHDPKTESLVSCIGRERDVQFSMFAERVERFHVVGPNRCTVSVEARVGHLFDLVDRNNENASAVVS